MASNKKTFYIEGKADFSDIINKFKQVRQQLQQKGASTSDLLNIDKQIQKIEQLQTALKAAVQKGFTSTSDVNSFQKSLEKMKQLASELGINLGDIDTKTITQGIESAEKAITKAEKEFKALKNEQSEVIKSSLNLSSNSKKYVQTLTNAANEGKDVKKVQEQITDEIQSQIDKQKELKNQAESEKSQKESERSNLGSMKGLSKRSFKTTTASGKEKNISDDQMSLVAAEYKRIANNSKDAGTAMVKFKKYLSENNITMANANTIEKHMGQSIDEVQTKYKTLTSDIKNAEAEIKSYDKRIEDLTEDQKTLGSSATNAIVSGAAAKIAEGETNRNNKVSAAAQQGTQLQMPSTIPVDVDEAVQNVQALTGALQEEGIQTNENIDKQEKFNQKLEDIKSRIQYFFSLGNAM
jgi:hypothetical protein